MSDQLDLFGDSIKDEKKPRIVSKSSSELRLLYFDLETQKSADEVGGWGNIHLMDLLLV